jgi:thioredoxin reductase
MPSGMALKSEGFASDLSSPDNYTLKRFCAEHDLPYRDFGLPIPRKHFVRYGLTFQERLVPEVEDRTVERIEAVPDGFRIRFDDGQVLAAARVVVAVGLTYFARMPDILANLPPSYVSHSSEHNDLTQFRGRKVVVLGGGSSATDITALLNEHGAEVHMVARRPKLIWLSQAVPRPWWQRALKPHTGIGFGLPYFAYMAAPELFRYLPQNIRQSVTNTALGPAGAFDVRDRVEGRVPILLSHSIRSVGVRDGRVALRLARADGTEHILTADHVIAATGFHTDVKRLELLSETIRQQLRLIGRAPELSANFESSVSGLYFTGAAAAFSFGPLLRFVAGTSFAAPRIARHLERMVRKAGPMSPRLDTVEGSMPQTSTAFLSRFPEPGKESGVSHARCPDLLQSSSRPSGAAGTATDGGPHFSGLRAASAAPPTIP